MHPRFSAQTDTKEARKWTRARLTSRGVRDVMGMVHAAVQDLVSKGVVELVDEAAVGSVDEAQDGDHLARDDLAVAAEDAAVGERAAHADAAEASGHRQRSNRPGRSVLLFRKRTWAAILASEVALEHVRSLEVNADAFDAVQPL